MEGYNFRIAAWWEATPVGGSEFGDRDVKLLDEVQKNYNCTVSFLYIPQGEIIEKLTASVLAKDPFADIVWMEANTAIPQMAAAGYIMETDSFFDFSDSKWPAYGLRCCEFRGKHYGFVANIASTYGIWYNKTFFAKNNLPDLYELQKSDQWNWEQFRSIAKAATKDTNNDGVNETYGFAEVGWEPIVDRFIASNGSAVVVSTEDGGYRFNVDDPAAKEAINFTVDLFQRGYKTEVENFMEGNTAMFAGDGFWGKTFLLEVDDEMGFVFFPKGPRATEYVCTSINSNIMCLPTNSKRPADAALIFEELTDWETLDERLVAQMETWCFTENDLENCKEMFNVCQLHKWKSFPGMWDIFLEKIFWDCVKNKVTLETALASHLSAGQAEINSILNAANAVQNGAG